MTRLITLLLFILTIASCRKDKPLFDGQSCNGSCYILTGKLLEFQSNLPLSNTQLNFYYRPSGNAIFFNPTHYLGKTTTATDGSYLFKFDSKNYKNPSGYFRIEGTRDGYIYNNLGDKIDNDLLIFDLDSSKIDIPQANNLTLFKAATIKFIIKATTITDFQSLTVTYSYGTNGFGPVINGKRSIDTTLTYKTASDIPTFINWSANGNGVNIQKKDTLIVPSGSEKIYHINL